MSLINLLLIALFIANLLMTKNCRYPRLLKNLRWAIVVIFSFYWGIGGYSEYPIISSFVSIIIIYFWFFILCVSMYRIIKNVNLNRV